nr:hypothetical protein [Haliscomenobacter sp.]
MQTPIIDTVITDELACDILAVNVTDKRYDASDDECYKIFRTYTVINWCVYDDRCGDPMAMDQCLWWTAELVDNYGKSPTYVLVRDRDRDQMKNSGCRKIWNPTTGMTIMYVQL